MAGETFMAYGTTLAGSGHLRANTTVHKQQSPRELQIWFSTVKLGLAGAASVAHPLRLPGVWSPCGVADG